MAEENKRSQITFGRAAEEWLRKKKSTVSIYSYSYYEQVMQNKLILELADVPMEQVCNKSFLISLEQKIRSNGYAQCTINFFMNQVKGITAYYQDTVRDINKYIPEGSEK